MNFWICNFCKQIVISEPTTCQVSSKVRFAKIINLVLKFLSFCKFCGNFAIEERKKTHESARDRCGNARKT